MMWARKVQFLLFLAAFQHFTEGIHGEDGFLIISTKDLPNGLGFPKDFEMNIHDWMQNTSIDPKLIENIKLEGNETDENGDLHCMHFLRKMAIKGLPAFNECMKEMQLTLGKLKKEFKDVVPCMAKCMGIKLNILHENGLFNYEYAKDLLSDNVPKRFMQIAWKIWDTCVDLVNQLKPNDPDCKTYRPVIKCTVDAGFKVAEEVIELCSDIPDVFKKTFKRMIKNKNKRRQMMDKDLK
ncbi:unnamed protein product [Allacma fusca]|uniref:Uncharacterized protein n=1 Tax=Allacma fusca TaxID=39272 RepID=A0A8J2JD24_9HEXA|nr:unnamed protein product [Allacma fusca]